MSTILTKSMAVIFPILKNVFQKNKKFNFPEFFIIIVLISLPQSGVAINSSAIIFFFIFSFLKFISQKIIVYNKISILLISFYILCILSLFWTNNIDNTKDGLVRFLSYLVIPIAFVFNSNKQFDVDKIIGLFSKSLVVYALYCILISALKALYYIDISFMFYHKLSSNLGNFNAIYLSVYVSFAISFYLNKHKKSALDLSSLVFLSFFLILLSSKIVIAITFLLSLIYFIRKRKFKKINKKYIFIILMISTIFILAGSNLSSRIKVEFEKTKINEVLNNKNFGHVYLWTGFGLRSFQTKVFIEILNEKEQFITGLGLNNSQESLNDKYIEYNLYPGFLNYNYHNQYIQVFAELGIIGLGMFLLIFFLIIKEAIITKDYFFVSFIILILAVCITESFLWRQAGMVYFIVISMLLSKRKKYLN